MKKIALDQEEKDMLNAYESGEFKSVMTEERKKSIQTIAANTIRGTYMTIRGTQYLII